MPIIDNSLFNKFTNLNPCTYEEFNSINSNIKYNSLDIQTAFYKALFTIIEESLKIMFSHNNKNPEVARHIYQAHGLTDEDFSYYLDLFLASFASKTLKDNYQNLIYGSILTNKEIFEEAKKVLWDNEALNNIAKRCCKTLNNINMIIKDYFTNVLKLNKSEITEYKKLYKGFSLFINLKHQNRKDFLSACEFYTKYATKEEKEAFKNTVLTILSIIKDNLNNNYLDEIHLLPCDLFLLAKNFLPDKAFLKQILFLYQPYYDFCCKVNWNRPQIVEQAKKQNMDYETFLKHAKDYATYILRIKDINEKIKTSRIYSKSETDMTHCLKRILASRSKSEVFGLFAERKIVRDDITRFCYSYNKNLPREKQQAIENNLLEKYYIWKKQTEKKETTAPVFTEELYRMYLQSEITLKEFCHKQGINVKSFKGKIPKLADDELRESLEQKIALEERIQEENYQNRIFLLLEYITNGISFNNNEYPFELCDFFILFPELNHEVLRTNFLDVQKATIIKKFLEPLRTAKYLNRESLIKGYIEKRVIDQSTKEESIHIFTPEEITTIIAFMDEHHIPMLDVLFHNACLKFINGSFTIYNNEVYGLK